MESKYNPTEHYISMYYKGEYTDTSEMRLEEGKMKKDPQVNSLLKANTFINYYYYS